MTNPNDLEQTMKAWYNFHFKNNDVESDICSSRQLQEAKRDLFGFTMCDGLVHKTGNDDSLVILELTTNGTLDWKAQTFTMR